MIMTLCGRVTPVGVKKKKVESEVLITALSK
jgi:hypothetical protein